MSEAVLGKGVLLKRGSGTSPETYTLVAEMLDIPDDPSFVSDLVDVTNHDSPGRRREFILGLEDGVEIQCRCNYTNSAQQNALKTDKDNNVARAFTVTYPQYSPELVVPFTALVREWTRKSPIESQITLEFTLKVTG